MEDDWRPQPPPKSTGRWPAPEIFVNMELGVSLSPRDPPHVASMRYASKNMRQRLYRPEREERRLAPHPSILVPGGRQRKQREQLQLQQQQQQQRQHPPSLSVITRLPYERASSAPPSIPDQSQAISPVSPLSVHRSSIFIDPRERNSMVIEPRERSNTRIDPRERPLPPLPSRFRLGEDELPWSVEAWYRPHEPELEPPRVTSPGTRRLEDPQRVRDLEELHQAMMTVDSLNDDVLETQTRECAPRGSVSLGWAVRSESVSNFQSPGKLEPPPPPYVVSQWEASFNKPGGRPHSAYS